MGLSNYDELVKTVQDYAHRKDLGTRINDFIELAEVEILSNPDRPLKMNLGEKIATAVTSEDSRFLALPTGFQSSRKFSITINDTIGGLKYRTPDQLRIRDNSGIPYFFTIRNNEIEFDILPDAEYTVTMTYFEDFTPLTEDNQTNIVLDKYPNIYLFGCLRQVFIFADDDQKLAKYSASFDSALDSANSSEEDTRYGPQPQETVHWAP